MLLRVPLLDDPWAASKDYRPGGGAKRRRFVEIHRGERVQGKSVALQFPYGTPEWDVYGRLLTEVPGGPDCLPLG